MLDPQLCPHQLKDLRQVETFPETWVHCQACEQMFLLAVVAGFDFPGSEIRTPKVVKALAGLSQDETPLQAFLAEGLTLGHAAAVRQGPSPAEPEDRVENMTTENPRWNKAS